MGPRPGPATARGPIAGMAGVGRGIARLGRAEGPKVGDTPPPAQLDHSRCGECCRVIGSRTCGGFPD